MSTIVELRLYKENSELKKAVQSSLKLAADQGFKSITMPAISSGIFGFPKDRCEDNDRGIKKNKT